MLNIRPIVVNSDFVILGGNQRYEACKLANLTEVSIIKAEDLTLEEQNEFIIKDNNNFGEWDFDSLANEWESDLLLDWGIDLPELTNIEKDFIKQIDLQAKKLK